uniref:Transposase-associated domain-containing protein n=1 Tax=Aegilops tauschii subsp. strangulata TaxID=200361 RepID=A0A453JNZ5_AEGTS|nr:uncharacterized protein LOC109736374 isoform X3 [Aegilops tauschii subsp. strangulata]
MTRHKSWMDRERDSVEWQTGMNDFLNLAFDGAHPDSTVPCPCRRCLNIVQKKKRDVHSDLLLNGMDPTYTHWIYHGEQSDEGSMSEDSDNEDDVDDGSGVCDMLNTLIRGTNMQSNENIGEGVGDIHVDDSSGDERNQEPNATAKVFFELLKEAKKELYPGVAKGSLHSYKSRKSKEGDPRSWAGLQEDTRLCCHFDTRDTIYTSWDTVVMLLNWWLESCLNGAWECLKIASMQPCSISLFNT